MALQNSPLQTAVAVLVGAIGVVGFGAQLSTVSSEVVRYSAMALAVTALLIASWLLWTPLRWRIRGAGAIPAVGRIRELCTRYEVWPATIDDIAWTAELERKVYSAADAVPITQFREWYGQNPCGFFIVGTSDRKKRVGQLNMLPIKAATLDRFVAGEITERGIRADSLYVPTERNRAETLYIESIAIDPSWRPRDAALLCLLSKALIAMSAVADVGTLKVIYAIAASRAGERILKDIGFQVAKAASERSDKHPMYRIDVSTLTKALQEICGDRLDLAQLKVAPG